MLANWISFLMRIDVFIFYVYLQMVIYPGKWGLIRGYCMHKIVKFSLINIVCRWYFLMLFQVLILCENIFRDLFGSGSTSKTILILMENRRTLLSFFFLRSVIFFHLNLLFVMFLLLELLILLFLFLLFKLMIWVHFKVLVDDWCFTSRYHIESAIVRQYRLLPFVIALNFIEIRLEVVKILIIGLNLLILIVKLIIIEVIINVIIRIANSIIWLVFFGFLINHCFHNIA